MTRLFRRAALAVAAVAAVLAVAAAGLLAWMSTSLPRIEGEIAVAGLTAPVEIRRDGRGIPDIIAGSETDAAFALGFVHAQDRLWQMETMRRLGSGRLAEVVGDLGVDTDHYMLTLGLYRRAEAQVERLSPPLRAVLDAYTAGVNAWLDQRDGALPPEFVLLLHAPEPWRPADSLVWGRLMAWRLATNRSEELMRARLAGRLTPTRLAGLLEETAGNGPVTGAATAVPPGAGTDAAAAAEVAGLDLRRLLDLEPWPPAAAGGASNFWAVNGSRSTTGKPLLANDPHLPYSIPGTWYLARITTPERTLVGATAPGVPFVVLGRNDRSAWGFTTAPVDTEDLVIERLSPLDPDRYETPSGTAAFAVTDAAIEVRFGPTVTVRVRESRHGPIVSDVRPDWIEAVAGGGAGAGPGHVVALAATWLGDDDRTAEAVFGLGRAGSWDEFRAALDDFHAPQQNVAYADVDGRIAFLAAGRVPIRPAGGGRRPVPGWTGEHDWAGFVPYGLLPQAIDPPTGRLVNANNRLEPPGYVFDLGGSYDPGFRAERILDLIDGRPRHDADSFQAIQADAVSLAARELARAMVAGLPEAAAEAGLAARLAGWDGSKTRDRAEPLIYAAWVTALFPLIVADELGEDLDLVSDDRPRFLLRVLSGDPDGWCDDRTTAAAEGCGDRLALALEQAVRRLRAAHGDDPGRWRWGDAHASRFSHLPLGQIPGVAGLTDRAIASDGGRHTANRAAWRGDGDQPFASVHGAGFRAVYDLADLERSRFMIAPGQSGNPFSRHYDDLLEPWRDGGWIEIRGGPAGRGDGDRRLVLRPAAAGAP